MGLVWSGATVDMDPSREATDRAMMTRCIELSRLAVSEGEHPFGTVIALDGQVVAEAINRNIRDSDVTRHAEVIALSDAQKTISREQLRHCTLYTNVEPCAMWSYCTSRSLGRSGGLRYWVPSHGRAIEMEHLA